MISQRDFALAMLLGACMLGPGCGSSDDAGGIQETVSQADQSASTAPRPAESARIPEDDKAAPAVEIDDSRPSFVDVAADSGIEFQCLYGHC